MGALDSNCIVAIDAATAGCEKARMVAWLERDLAATKAPWRVVLIHRRAVATGKYGVYPQIPVAEMGRVTTPGGTVLVVDYAPPRGVENVIARLVSVYECRRRQPDGLCGIRR